MSDARCVCCGYPIPDILDARLVPLQGGGFAGWIRKSCLDRHRLIAGSREVGGQQ